MAKLIVQIDHVATLREAGKTNAPDPTAAAVLAELGGADGIAVHLCDDRRHIQDRDLRMIRKVTHTKLLLKMAATSEMLGVALNIKPDAVILMSEKREDLLPESGLDLMVHRSNVAETIETLDNSGIPAGVFIEPDPEQLKLAHQCSAKTVEINTAAFGEAATSAKRAQALTRITDAVKLAYRLKIDVQVGKGIGYDTIGAFEGLREIAAFTIGHGIVARAVLTGMENAVREMRTRIKELPFG